MSTNRTYTGDKRIPFSWEAFDALPRETKEFLWNFPISAFTNQKVITKAMRQRAAEKCRRIAERTWGPDHPQAAITLETLGL